MSKKTIVKVILKTSFILGKSLINVMNKIELLNTIQVEEQVTPKSENRKFFCSLTFWGHLTHVYYTIHERLNKNTYLTFTNSSK